MWMLCVLLAASGAVNAFQTLQAWDFNDAAECGTWQANGHLAEVTCEGGMLKARAVDWDPFLTCTGLNLPAKAAQCIRLRLRASSGGKGQLFWSGQTSGQYGGFDPSKVADFEVHGGDVEEVYLFPYWHKEETIRQLRLDVYDGASFEIDSIAVLEAAGAAQTGETPAWDLGSSADVSGWAKLNGGHALVAPAIGVPLDDIGWFSIEARADVDTSIAVYWSTTAMLGSRHETIYLPGDGLSHVHHVELQGTPGWDGSLAGLHVDVAEPEKVNLGKVTLSAEPAGPPEMEARYFGLENAVSRAGREELILAQIINRGGGMAAPGNLRLELPEGVQVVGGPVISGNEGLLHGEMLEARWTVKAAVPQAYPAVLLDDSGKSTAAAALSFAPPCVVDAAYVPEPRPIATSHEILAYYFPGWNDATKWDCIRNTAPIRRPLLGYYDEGKVDCVDWQIKWAVENGISCFLVDWYWCAGGQYLLHWFDAYRVARYRDMLKVALMWANHNPPKTHSREDWRAVTREWIDKYFTLDSYYHVDGKPAVYIWNAAGIREDLGGSEEVAAAFAESREMARAAGHKGITFISLRHTMTEAEVALLAKEGYDGQTSYHEWGDAAAMAPAPPQGRYDDMVATVPDAWEKRRSISGALAYYPVVDTGWDSRPWHGDNSTVFHGRSVEGFRKLLQSARDYCERHNENTIILGPLNEWGEGSYVEPNLEFGGVRSH